MLARSSLGNFLRSAWYTSQTPNRNSPFFNAGLYVIPLGTACHSYWAALYFAVTSRRTNREVEIKLSVVDLPALIGALQRLGGRLPCRVFEQNTLYDTSESDLRRRGYLLRLRVETPAGSSFARPGARRAVLTSKVPPSIRPHGASRIVTESRYKERLERELTVQHAGRWGHMLKSLGFLPAFRYEKYRTSFRLPGLHLDLDETPVGIFLELEGIPKAIDQVAVALGYMHHDYIRATYWDIYVASCKRKRQVVRNMVFDTQKMY